MRKSRASSGFALSGQYTSHGTGAVSRSVRTAANGTGEEKRISATEPYIVVVVLIDDFAACPARYLPSICPHDRMRRFRLYTFARRASKMVRSLFGRRGVNLLSSSTLKQGASTTHNLSVHEQIVDDSLDLRRVLDGTSVANEDTLSVDNGLASE